MLSMEKTCGVQGTLSTQSNEGLTGEELVNQIQMRIQQRDVKSPSFNAYAQEVFKTGGFPTKKFEDYSDLDNNFYSNKPAQQLQSSGGGLMGSLGGFNVQKPVLSIGNTGQNRSPFAKGGLAKILEV